MTIQSAKSNGASVTFSTTTELELISELSHRQSSETVVLSKNMHRLFKGTLLCSAGAYEGFST